MNRILTNYITKNFLYSFLIVFSCFFIIVSALESTEIFRKYFSNTINIVPLAVIELIVYRTIVTVTSFFSFIVFLSGIVFFYTMHTKFELIVMKVVGFSTKDISAALFKGVSILALLYITLFDILSAYSIGEIKNIDTNLKQETRGIDKNPTITNSGVWFKNTNGISSYIISVKSFDNTHINMYNVRIFEFNRDNILKRSIHSHNGIIQNGNWILANCHIFDNNGRESFQGAMSLPINLSFSQINKMVINPESVPFWSIWKYSNMMEKVGLSTVKYKVNWYSRLSAIAQMFSFMVLVIAFCINYIPRNSGIYGIKITLLLLLVFPIYFFSNILLAFGENGMLPLWLASFIVPVVVLALGTLILEKQ